MPDWLVQWIIGGLSAAFAAGGAYTAVKMELRRLNEKIASTHSLAAHAHRRIDEILIQRE